MTRFPPQDIWCPGHVSHPGSRNQPGARRHAATGHGNRYLARVLGEAAVGAARTNTFWRTLRRIAKRRGKKRALVAVGRSILVIVWHLLADPDSTFHDLGPGFHNTRTATDRHAATTSANSKHSATPSPRTRRLTHPTQIRLRCAPPGAIACPYSSISDSQVLGMSRPRQRQRESAHRYALRVVDRRQVGRPRPDEPTRAASGAVSRSVRRRRRPGRVLRPLDLG